MTDREPGPYWVKFGGGWEVATLGYTVTNEIPVWLIAGSGRGENEAIFDEIGPRIDRDETERLKARVAELDAALGSLCDNVYNMHMTLFVECAGHPATNRWGQNISLHVVNDCDLAATRARAILNKGGKEFPSPAEVHQNQLIEERRNAHDHQTSAP